MGLGLFFAIISMEQHLNFFFFLNKLFGNMYNIMLQINDFDPPLNLTLRMLNRNWVFFGLYIYIYIYIYIIDNSRTGLDTSKNQCSAPAVTALKNYWRYHVYNLFRLKNSSNVFAFIIIIIGCLTGNIIHDQLKLRPYFLPWVSKNRRYV